MSLYHILRADPAGNITVFVLDDVALENRPAVAKAIMKKGWLHCEQVGFVCPPRFGGDGRFEMMGGEFCGNATRAYGMYLARQEGRDGEYFVETSGCAEPWISVMVDGEAASAQMPLPQEIWQETVAGHPGTLVHLGGIAHLVLEDAQPDLALFEAAEPMLASIPGLEAYGVIFLNGDRMTPLVKVPATNSLVWEGSCGSGTVAAAIVQSEVMQSGTFSCTYRQPDGDISAQITRENGEITAASIGGQVFFSSPVEIDLDL